MFPYLRTSEEFLGDCKIGYKIIGITDASTGKVVGYKVDGYSSKKTPKPCCNYDLSKELDPSICATCQQVPVVVGWLIQRVNNANWGSDYGSDGVGNVSFMEIAVWCQSLCKCCKYVIEHIDVELKKNLVIGLEYYLENSFEIRKSATRVDIMIGGYDKQDKTKMKVLILELKGWKDLSEDNRIREAAKQVAEYKHNICLSVNDDPNLLKIEFIPYVYAHNLDQGTFSDKYQINDGQLVMDIPVIYMNTVDNFKDFINDSFCPKNGKEVFREIRSRYKTLNSSAFAEILCDKDIFRKYEDYLRPDQRFVYNELKRHIVLSRFSKTDIEKVLTNKEKKKTPLEKELLELYKIRGKDVLKKCNKDENDFKNYYDGLKDHHLKERLAILHEDLVNYCNNSKKPIDIIHGGPGSGKTLIMILLMGYCTYLGLDHQWVYSRSAPIREIYYREVIKILNEKTTELMNYPSYTKADNLIKELVSLFTIVYGNKPKFVEKIKQDDTPIILYDEAHRYISNRDYNDFYDRIIKNKPLVQLYYDKKQKIEAEDGGVSHIETLKKTLYPDFCVREYNLGSQFRCGRDEGYLTWVEQKLGLSDGNEIAPYTIGKGSRIKRSDFDFEFKPIDSEKGAYFDIFEKMDEELNKLDPNMSKCIIVRNYTGKLKGEIDKYKKQKNKATKIGDLDVLSIKESHGIEYDVVFVIIRQKDNLMGIIKNKDECILNEFRIMMTRGLKKCYILNIDHSVKGLFEDPKDNI